MESNKGSRDPFEFMFDLAVGHFFEEKGLFGLHRAYEEWSFPQGKRFYVWGDRIYAFDTQDEAISFAHNLIDKLGAEFRTAPRGSDLLADLDSMTVKIGEIVPIALLSRNGEQRIFRFLQSEVFLSEWLYACVDGTCVVSEVDGKFKIFSEYIYDKFEVSEWGMLVCSHETDYIEEWESNPDAKLLRPVDSEGES